MCGWVVSKQRENDVEGEPNNGNPDQDVTVEYTYNRDDRIATIKAKQTPSAIWASSLI